MIADVEKFKQQLKKWLQQQALLEGTKGFIVHLDGTLASQLLVCLLREFEFDNKVIITPFSDNKQFQQKLIRLIKKNQMMCTVVEPIGIAKSNFEMNDYDSEIIYKYCVSDTIVKTFSEIEKRTIVGNICKEQYYLNFPHIIYQDRNRIFPFLNLYYSEIKALANLYNIEEDMPSFCFYPGYYDEVQIGCSYLEIEKGFREQKASSTVQQVLSKPGIILRELKSFNITRPSDIIK